MTKQAPPSMPSDVHNLMQGMKAAIVRAVADCLPTGVAPRPQIHVIDDTLEQPYVGYVVCRYYYRGRDAMAAISHLGRIAAVMCASHLLVVWEESDLRVSMSGGDPDEHPRGLAVLEAPFLPPTHTLRWQPFQLYTSDGTPLFFTNPAIDVAWGHPSHSSQVPLPEPIETLLMSWRTTPFGQGVQRTLSEAVDAGYEFHFARR